MRLFDLFKMFKASKPVEASDEHMLELEQRLDDAKRELERVLLELEKLRARSLK